jgi:WhiB family redox-sensing transcriptional regulator
MTTPETTPDEETWERSAICRGLPPRERRLFVSNDPDDWLTAKEHCWECPVREPCRNAAFFRREPAGVWGGLDEHQRARRINSYDPTRTAA